MLLSGPPKSTPACLHSFHDKKSLNFSERSVKIKDESADATKVQPEGEVAPILECSLHRGPTGSGILDLKEVHFKGVVLLELGCLWCKVNKQINPLFTFHTKERKTSRQLRYVVFDIYERVNDDILKHDHVYLSH